MIQHDKERFIDKICDLLRQERRPCTQLRQNMLRILLDVPSINVKELGALLEQRYDCTASIQAIYDNLKLFSAFHLVAKKYDQTSVCYEPLFKRYRFHTVCTRCKRIHTLRDDVIFDAVHRKCAEFGFQPTNIDVLLYGICRECQNDNH